MLELRPYQNKAVHWGLKEKRGYIMLDLGTGKTAIALNIIKESKKRFLVIAPLKPMYMTWPDEIAIWTPNMSYSILHDKAFSTELNKNKQLYLINPEGMKRLYFALEKYYKKHKALPFDSIIIDEGHEWKSHKSIRFKVLKSLLPGLTGYRFIMGATPNPNGYHDLWSQYYILDEGKRLGKNITAYRNKYFRRNQRCIYKYDFIGDKFKLFDQIRDLTFRIKNLDLKLSSKYLIKHIELSKAEYELYSSLKKHRIIGEYKAKNDGVLLNTLRQYCQGAVYHKHPQYTKYHSAKINILDELLVEPTVVFFQFRFELDMLLERYPLARVIAGGTKSKDALKYMREWNTGKCKLLICHPASMSSGVNIQFGGRQIIWLALPWDLAQYQQANGRLLRPGQTKTVKIWHLLARDTIDTVVYNALRTKTNIQEATLNYL